jgi:hypothetical protein
MADRKLDALVAEKVMGHDVMSIGVGETRDLAHYSSDIACAWQVVEKLLSQNIEVGLLGSPGDRPLLWQVELDEGTGAGEIFGDAHTAPMAICLAALKACGVEL